MLQADDTITLDKGAYRLRAQLACSAYGVVWQAQAPNGAPDVALKLINRVQMVRAEPALQAHWPDSAKREIAFLQSLAPWDERHIVRLLDSGAHDSLPVMALELMHGDLGQQRRATPDMVQVLEWIGQVNQALAKVHQYGWLYLDLKPANVLLTRHGAARLADFGTNRLRSSLPAHSYTGTANWQAPEQFFPNAGQQYATDARTDYFALGALFYYLVTGGTPLRFCSACGQAYREHQAAAAAALLARPGGIGPTLHDDEAALFVERFAGLDERADATWCPTDAGRRPAAAALALLRALLDADPAGRPQNALQVSRMLGTIGAQPTPTLPLAAMRTRATRQAGVRA